MIRSCIALSVVGLTSCGAPEKNVPTDAVASTTLCADTYVLAIPELEPRLAGLSWQSRSSLSRAPRHLQTLPQLNEDLERLQSWKSATIVSSAGSQGDINLNWGEDFDIVWSNLETLATSLNVTDPTPKLKAELDKIPRPTKPLRLLYLDRSGATAGTGTFVDAVIRKAGAKNIASTAGWHSPDIENLIALQPDAIITSFMGSNYSGVNDTAVRHAALVKKIDGVPQIDIHGGLWPCAGPGLIEATLQLSKALSKL